jgi:hypothetical protein
MRPIDSEFAVVNILVLGLDGQGLVVRLLVRDRHFCTCQCVKTGSVARQVSCPADYEGPFRKENRMGREADHLTPSTVVTECTQRQ